MCTCNAYPRSHRGDASFPTRRTQHLDVSPRSSTLGAQSARSHIQNSIHGIREQYSRGGGRGLSGLLNSENSHAPSPFHILLSKKNKKKQIKDVSFSAPCSPKSYSREKTRKKHTLSGRRDLFPGRRSIIFAAPKSSPPPPRVPCPLPARSIAQRYLRDEAATACSSGVPIVSYTFSFVSVEVQTRGASPFPKCSSRFPAHPSLPALRAFTNLHFSRPHRMRNFPLSSRVLPQSSFPFFLLLP